METVCVGGSCSLSAAPGTVAAAPGAARSRSRRKGRELETARPSGCGPAAADPGASCFSATASCFSPARKELVVGNGFREKEAPSVICPSCSGQAAGECRATGVGGGSSWLCRGYGPRTPGLASCLDASSLSGPLRGPSPGARRSCPRGARAAHGSWAPSPSPSKRQQAAGARRSPGPWHLARLGFQGQLSASRPGSLLIN